MRLRRARALVVLFDEARPVVFNFLTRQSFTCNLEGLGLLAAARDWQEAADFFARWPQYQPASVAAELSRLIDVGALVVEGSQSGRRDEAYAEAWEWGALAGLFHFSIMDGRFMTTRQAIAYIKRRSQTQPSPPLYQTNAGYASVAQLPRPQMGRGVFPVMLRRRTARVLAPKAITQQQLGDCLYAAVGITGFIEDPAMGRLPLKPTPSGGARNPYEAYVYALRVRGLRRGIYHYSALENSLGLVTATQLPAVSRLLAGQRWAADGAAIVFLTAQLERTMWKYRQPIAYRVVMIEAGHIGQNLALAATAHGLTVAPTCAFSDTLLGRALKLTAVTHAVIYALVLGTPRRSAQRAVRLLE
jgi:SagB-type dehydrogenase family enzyme